MEDKTITSNYIVLGTLASPKVRMILDSLKARNEPGDLPQQYILKALSKDDRNSVSFIGTPRIEKYHDCYVKRVPFDRFCIDKVECLSVGYNNRSYLSLLFRKHNFVKECKKWARNHRGISLNIVVYSLCTTFLEGALAIRKIIPNSKICVIVPDLPLYMSYYKWPISWVKKINVLRIERLRKKVDFYSLYSEQMADYLSLDKNKYIVTEGFIDKEKIILNNKKPSNEHKICVYAGDLHPSYGIQTLVDAFNNIDVDCELRLYGKDKYLNLIRFNNNVKYCGYVSPDEMFEIMKGADLLINPRPSSLKLASYSFPSKTFEYMASGTPCIMCILPGVPEEYFEYVYTFKEENEFGFKNSISELLSKSDIELREKGKKAAVFLLNNKTTEKQLSKIINKFRDS